MNKYIEENMDELDNIVRYMVRNVAPNMKDDCYQAAFLGIMEAAKKYDPSKSKFTTYINNHKGYIQAKIFKEIATLSLPFTISKTTFVHLIRYNRGDVSKFTDGKIRAMDKLSKIKQFKYDKYTEN